MAASLLAVLLWLFCALFGAVFLIQRFRYRSRLRRGMKQPGHYPEIAALGNALHTLQIAAVPQIAYVMQGKLDEPAEEAGSDEPDEEVAMRRHILKQAVEYGAEKRWIGSPRCGRFERCEWKGASEGMAPAIPVKPLNHLSITKQVG